MSKLYVVATPIGNLSDITLRAIEILKGVDLILSEDTRETAKILKQYSITTPQLSYRDQNHSRILPKILEQLDFGKTMALTSDSGTPLISDPGFKLIKELAEKGYEIIPIPGPSAVIAALAVSGLPTDKFIFLGFLSKKKSRRIKTLQAYGNLDTTLTIYESPFRIIRLLEEIFEVLGDRVVCVANDLTKVHEDIIRGHVKSILENSNKFRKKGEYVVLVAKESFKYGQKYLSARTRSP